MTADAIEFPAIDPGLAKMRKAFDLEKIKDEWGKTLRQISETQFREGGNRVGAPLLAGDSCLGLIILDDRVNGVPYTVEELEMFQCIGHQFASGLLHFRS